MLMFYSGYDGRLWRTGLAGSGDGLVWRKSPQPVLEPSSAGWDSVYIAANGSALYIPAPGSVLLPGGKFYYWYQGGRLARIGLATSAQGQHWSKHPGPVLEPGPPGSWDGKAVADPYVLRCGEALFLYYLGQDATDTQRLGVASSRDGIHWARYEGNPVLVPGPRGSLDERGVGEPAVVPVAGGLAMFYTGRDGREFRRIGLALSSDGVTWRKSGVALDVARSGWDSRVVADPHVLISGDRLLVWYGGGDVASPDQNLHGHIGLATGRVEQGLLLEYAQAAVYPTEWRRDTPNGRWAFPYRDNSLVTLARSSLRFLVEVPAQARFRASVHMPMPGADPTGATVRVNCQTSAEALAGSRPAPCAGAGQELFSRPAIEPGQKPWFVRGAEMDLDLERFAGQKVELELAATAGPRGERASWVEWRYPRIVVRARKP